MKLSKKMTLDEYIETADDLAIVTHHLSKIFFRCQKHYPKTHRLMKLLYKVLPNAFGSVLIKIQSELDNEYHKAIDDEQFKQLGHIYYNLEKRYEKIRERNG